MSVSFLLSVMALCYAFMSGHFWAVGIIACPPRYASKNQPPSPVTNTTQAGDGERRVRGDIWHGWDTDVYTVITNLLTGGFTCGAGHTAGLTHFFQGHFSSTDISLHSNVFCLFLLCCYPTAPDESENVVQSDETENGILLSHLTKCSPRLPCK